MSEVDYTKPVSYQWAHSRTARVRGKASNQECEGCGREAQEWAYQGGSQYEVAGTYTKHKRGVSREVSSVWSPHPDDYLPLCQRCHAEWDGKPYRTGYRYDQAKAEAASKRWRDAFKAKHARPAFPSWGTA